MRNLSRRSAGRMLGALCLSPFLTLAGGYASPSDSPWDHAPGWRSDDARRAVANNSAAPADIHRFARAPRTRPNPIVAREGMVRSVMTNERVAALTFDLCELETVTTGYDAAVIDYLREEALPATLFLGGKWMRTHAVRTKQLMTDPLFEIGSHAWSHGNFGIMDECAMREQIRWTDAQYAALRETVMREAKTPEARAAAAAIPAAMRFFRLPYGRTSELGLRVLADEGFDVIQWSVSGDSVLDMTPEEEGRATALRVNPGGILLFHANRVPKNAPAILRATVDTLRRLGYRFASVSTLLTLGEPFRTHAGYFEMPGDNLDLDGCYGINGTGRKKL